MPRGYLGILIGFVLGFALIFGGFGDMLIVALFGAIGFAVNRVIDGELDLSRFLGSGSDR
ncbi:MAG: DUF2273 domain-containing protein [Frankia sp.]